MGIEWLLVVSVVVKTLTLSFPLLLTMQYAVVFKTPPYYNMAIERPVTVMIALRRPSDKESSDPKPFTYLPQEFGKGNEWEGGGKKWMCYKMVEKFEYMHVVFFAVLARLGIMWLEEACKIPSSNECTIILKHILLVSLPPSMKVYGRSQGHSKGPVSCTGIL